jgi:hypothetical protein
VLQANFLSFFFFEEIGGAAAPTANFLFPYLPSNLERTALVNKIVKRLA